MWLIIFEFHSFGSCYKPETQDSNKEANLFFKRRHINYFSDPPPFEGCFTPYAGLLAPARLYLTPLGTFSARLGHVYVAMGCRWEGVRPYTFIGFPNKE